MERCNYSSSDFFDECVASGVSNKFDGSNPDRHIAYWDYNALLEVGQYVGLSYSIPLYRGSSVAAPFTNLCVFDNTEPQVSLYFEFVK